MFYITSQSQTRKPLQHQCHVAVNDSFPRLKPNPHCWNYVAYVLRICTTVSNWNPLTSYYFRSTTEVNSERRKHSYSKYWYIIHPLSWFRRIWQVCMLIAWLVVLPFDVFESTFHLRLGYEVICWLENVPFIIKFLNILCNLDILMNFFTGYIDISSKKIVIKQRKIAWKYIFSYFIFDMISLTNTVGLYFGLNTSDPQINFPLISIRILRIVRLKTILDYLKEFMSGYSWLEDWYDFVQWSVLFFFGVFYCGCLSCLVPDVVSYYTGKERKSWMHHLEKYYNQQSKQLTSTMLFAHCLAESFYIMLSPINHFTRTTIEDTLICTLTMFIGIFVLVHLFVISYWKLHNLYYPTAKYNAFMDQLENYMTNNDLDETVRRNLRQFYQTNYKAQYFNEADILSTMPKRMRFEIFTHTSMNLYRNCNLFENLPFYFLFKLTSRLKHEFYQAGDYIMMAGTHGNCMFFLSTGTIAIYTADDKEMHHLIDGEYFGNIELIYKMSDRITNAVAIEPCEIFRLNAKDFYNIFSPDSVFYQRVAKSAKNSLDRYNKFKRRQVYLDSRIN